MSLLGLKSGCIYGPVSSRRLGASLGINLLPRTAKACTFDCVYCQYGWTRRRSAPEEELPAEELVVAELEASLAALDAPPDFITFSGNGEATMHPDFAAIVTAVTGARDRLAPLARTAILSNSSTVGDPEVCRALAWLDRRIMKLDAGREETFRAFNRPAADLRLDDVLEGLRRLDDVTLQTLLAGGPGGNASDEDIAALVEATCRVGPRDVQVYTLARDWPSRAIEPLAQERLEEVAEQLRGRGIDARAF